MKRTKTDSFIIERRIYTNKVDASYIDKKLNMCNRLYNKSAKHYIEQLEKMKKDIWFQISINKYFQLEKENNEKYK